jgi:hypothetical protein
VRRVARRWVWLVLGLAGAAGCGRIGFEAVAAACRTDEDCHDDLFCNGAERCLPSAPGADLRGCAPAASPPCTGGNVCDEGTGACLPRCEVVVDLDADGSVDGQCGGVDCDGDRAATFPGAPELCDGHDNDCDATVDEGASCSFVLGDATFGDGRRVGKTWAVVLDAVPVAAVLSAREAGLDSDSDVAVNGRYVGALSPQAGTDQITLDIDGSRFLAGENRITLGPAGFCPDPCTAGWDDYELYDVTLTLRP